MRIIVFGGWGGGGGYSRNTPISGKTHVQKGKQSGRRGA